MQHAVHQCCTTCLCCGRAIKMWLVVTYEDVDDVVLQQVLSQLNIFDMSRWPSGLAAGYCLSKNQQNVFTVWTVLVS